MSLGSTLLCNLPAARSTARVMPFRCTVVVTQAEIVRAMEDGTSAELRLRDWDLEGATSVAARQSHALAEAALWQAQMWSRGGGRGGGC